MKNRAIYIKYSLLVVLLFVVILASNYSDRSAGNKQAGVQTVQTSMETKIDSNDMSVNAPQITKKKGHHAHLHTGCSCSHCQGEGPLVKPTVTRLSAMELKDIPESRFKTEILALSSEFQRSALDTLASIDFQGEDLESLHCDYKGGIYYSCKFEPADNIEESKHVLEKSSLEESEAALPISAPPIYHSRPGAVNVIFLDFNGGKVVGTRWNTGRNVKEWDCKPFDDDGDETTFSDSEQKYIRLIWERVSEDYSSFNVDVTTEEPKVWSSTTAHAMITPGTDKNGLVLPHSKSGGVAFVGTFGSYDYSYNQPECTSPAWVKVSGHAVDGYSNIAEAASHEVGHNMGLKHDTTNANSNGYYGGHEHGSISWGPIMGTGYTRNLSQWSKGEYYDYYNVRGAQDDIEIIADKLTYKADEGGSTNGTASPLSTTNGGTIKQAGVIAESGDIDVYSFVSGAGQVSFIGTTYRASLGPWGSNLDMELQLQDSTGKVLVTNNPVADNNASVSYNLPSVGTYYLHVKPVGVGNPSHNPPSGYTAYGSVGQYTLTGQVVPVDGLVVQTPNGGETYYQGGSCALTWTSPLGGNVKIELLKNDSVVKLLSASTENDGAYEWHIPGGQEIGRDYSMKITSLSNGTKIDSSDAHFSVASFFPYTEDFEHGFGQWTHSRINDREWQLHTGPSTIWQNWAFGGERNKAGPSGAQGGIHYLMAEDLYAGDQNFLLETEFNFSPVSNPQLSFFYHMYGPSTRHLAVDLSTDGGTTWNNVWVKDGNQGDGWKNANVNLTSYGGSPRAKVRFKYLSNKQTTIGLDTISITASSPFPSRTIALGAPNGNEKYASGETREIRWGTSDLPGKVKIELYDDGKFRSTIVAQTDNDGSYAWSIPADLSGAGLTVKVTSLEAGAATDESDASFSIINTFYSADMSTKPDWDLDEGWAYGKPAGNGGDPTAGYTGNNVVGYNLSGLYSQIDSTVWATTKKIDCSNYTNVKLNFRRWLGVEGALYDHAYVQVSKNKTDWTTFWENAKNVSLQEGIWSYQEIDISSVADEEASVYIRWGMGSTDISTEFSGWNLDDVQVKGSQKAPSSFNIIASAGSNGSVSPVTQQVGAGESALAITATANEGYHFTGWSGDASGTVNPLIFTNVTAGKSVTASFAVNTFTVTFDLAGKGTRSGGGALSQEVQQGMAATAPTVNANNGWSFDGWDVVLTNVTRNLRATAQYTNHPDLNNDGLWDSLQQQIIAADNNDSIKTLDDVKGADDFDQDGISNLEEQKQGSDPITFDKELYPGWNLLHYPRGVTGADDNMSLRFTNKEGDVWLWDAASGAYTKTQSLSIGSAVWVYWQAQSSIQMPGTVVKAHSISLKSGWNMMGTPFTAQKMVSEKVSESIWYWSAGTKEYEKLLGDTLAPGTGYWVYALEPVNLTLQAK